VVAEHRFWDGIGYLAIQDILKLKKAHFLQGPTYSRDPNSPGTFSREKMVIEAMEYLD